jgi:AbrB family looped-hinge helix DNA binding protein
MKATIDSAGRLVIPKPLRERIGLRPGVVDITVEGSGLRVEPLAGDELEERDGRLLVPRSGTAISDDLVSDLRDADER